jgi:enoyl-CoA hydratase/carnithine racemase
MATSPLQLHCQNSIAHLVLSSPPKNEMGAEFFEELARISNSLATMNVRGLIVRGARRHFSSGANVEELRSRVDTAALVNNSDSFSILASLPFPTVAAIRGCCLGSGLELALACRFRVADRNAVLGLPEATFNLLPGCGGTVRLTKLAGYRNAIRMILTGESMLAQDALCLGLVDAVVDKSDVETAAIRFVERLG